MMKLHKCLDVLRATPDAYGCLLNLYGKNAVRFARLQTIVLDESEMLDLKFSSEPDALLAVLAKCRLLAPSPMIN